MAQRGLADEMVRLGNKGLGGSVYGGGKWFWTSYMGLSFEVDPIIATVIGGKCGAIYAIGAATT